MNNPQQELEDVRIERDSAYVEHLEAQQKLRRAMQEADEALFAYLDAQKKLEILEEDHAE